MDIKYFDKQGILEAQLSRDANGQLFQAIADEITKTFKVQWQAKIEGPDQRYWDFQIDDVRLTLHYEHFLGILLIPYENQSEKTKQYVIKISEHLKNWDPPFADK